MKPRPQQSQCCQVHLPFCVVGYLPMKFHIFQWRFSMCFSVTVLACGCIALLHIALLQFHLMAMLLSFLFSGSLLLQEMEGPRMQVKCRLFGWEHIYSHLYFFCLSWVFITKLLYTLVISAQGRGHVLCSLLIHIRNWLKGFSQLCFFVDLP